MNFRRRRSAEEPEINLVAMIDVLLVILIFLMVSTTYSQYSSLEINLPTSDVTPEQEQPGQISVVITASGDVLINKTPVRNHDVSVLAESLARLRPANGAQEPIVVINADAKTAHQRVVDVMQAAQQVGLSHISFATQESQH
ncbi:MAG: biopolymer transporter ExbD [Sulfuritalea sp.]|nr:biopolymer transporter ExbD [Sulfuritalea sp.]